MWAKRVTRARRDPVDPEATRELWAIPAPRVPPECQARPAKLVAPASQELKDPRVCGDHAACRAARGKRVCEESLEKWASTDYREPMERRVNEAVWDCLDQRATEESRAPKESQVFAVLKALVAHRESWASPEQADNRVFRVPRETLDHGETMDHGDRWEFRVGQVMLVPEVRVVQKAPKAKSAILDLWATQVNPVIQAVLAQLDLSATWVPKANRAIPASKVSVVQRAWRVPPAVRAARARRVTEAKSADRVLLATRVLQASRDNVGLRVQKASGDVRDHPVTLE